MKNQLFFNGNNLPAKFAFATMILMMLTGSGTSAAIDDVQVTGTLPTITLSITPSNQDVQPPAGSTTFTVSSNADWTAVSDQLWCSVTPSGTGDGTITATYTLNNTASQRIANITVAVAGLSPVVVTVTQAAPVIAVSPQNYDVDHQSGLVVFNVISNTSWTVSEDQSWCSVTPSYASGNGTFSAFFTANQFISPRIAEITIAVDGLPSVIVTVTQAAAPLSLTVTPTNQNVSSSYGNTTFTVTTTLSWSAGSDQLWCTVTHGGVGNGNITATYLINTTDLTRVANISITAEGVPTVVVTVTQANSKLNVTPSNRSVPKVSGFTQFNVSSIVNWTVSSNQPWCTVTPSGSGNGVIIANFNENNTNEIRVAHITVSAPGEDPVVVTVTQLNYTGSDDFLLSVRYLTQTSPNSLEFDVFLLCTDTIQPFELASIQFGFLLNSDIYTGGVLSATYDNTGSGLNLSQQFTSQTSIAYIINGYPGLTLIRQAGKAPPGTGNGTIISTTGDGTFITHYTFTNTIPFTANSYANLTFTSSTATNPLYATRVAAYIDGVNTQLGVFSGTNAIIPQNPQLNGPPDLKVTPVSQTVDTTAGNFGFTVTSNTSWTAQADQPWVTVTPSGFGNGTMIATYSGNTSEPRTAVITVSVSGLEDVEVILSQEGVSVRTLNLNLLIEGLYAGNGTMNQAQNQNGPHFGSGIADVVTMELHNSSDYAIIEHVVSDVEVSIAGNAMINLPTALNGAYYITIKHRNSIETTSASPVSFATQTIDFAFDLPDMVYGGNLQLMIDGHYVIKSGDINHDGSVDTGDMTLVDNDAAGYVTGYIVVDVNGDGIVDTADMTIVDNNSAAYVTAETP